MFIFNKYNLSIEIKILNYKNINKKFFSVLFNYNNNIIHGILINFSLNLFFYNSILYKNRFKKFINYNIFYLNYITFKNISLN